MGKVMFYFKKRHRSVILAIVILLIIGIVIVQARPPGPGILNVEQKDIGAHVLNHLEGIDLKVPEGGDAVKDFDQIPENDLINGQMHIEQRQEDEEEEEDSKEQAIGHGRPMAIEEDNAHLDGAGKKSQQASKKLALDDLQPPDHLDAVRLEQDGHLNRDYKKEIFLGNHEEIENGSEEMVVDKLKDIFHKVDTGNDGFISEDELEKWIELRIKEHFQEAAEENEVVFRQLDTDTDGLITWKEFHVQFLQAKGYDERDAEKHAEDYDTLELDGEVKEQIIRHKFRWADADEEPQDNALSLKEFKSFRHPEQSSNMLGRMVRDILDNLDKDNDGILTEEEFTALPPGEVDEKWREVDQAWQDERRKEFRDVIDLDKDGKVTKDELKNYVDPKNPSHALLEAKNLIQLADTDRDGRLSLTEVLDNTDLFLGSKMVNTGRSFHDEF